MRMVRWLAVWAVCALLMAVILTEAARVAPGHLLWDFGSFVASGRAAAQGLDPYGVYELTFHVSLPGFESANPNLNPPVSALLFQLFDTGDPHSAFRIWRWMSVGFYTATLLLLFERYGASPLLVIGALAAAGFWDTLLLGQIYLPLVLAAVTAWLLLERGAGHLAGILIGLVAAMKPNFLVWPVLLFLAGHGRPALTAAVTFGVVSALPAFVLGPDVYRQWFDVLAGDADRARFPTNASLLGIASRGGLPGAGMVLSVALLLGAAAWALLRRPGTARVSAFALLASVLASPLGWIHYTLFLLPVILERWSKPTVKIAALALCVPVPFVVGQLTASPIVQTTVGSVYGWALLLLLASLVADEVRLRRAGAVQPPEGAEPGGSRDWRSVSGASSSRALET